MSQQKEPDYRFWEMATTVGGFALLFLLFYFFACAPRLLRPEEAAREQYAQARAACQHETGEIWGEKYRACIKERGWRE